jgi:hypothetical protein
MQVDTVRDTAKAYSMDFRRLKLTIDECNEGVEMERTRLVNHCETASSQSTTPPFCTVPSYGPKCITAWEGQVSQASLTALIRA